MTLPITIPIGDLTAGGPDGGVRDLRLITREVRFRAPRACRLGRLHVERADCVDVDQRGLVAVLGDVDLELRGATDEDRIARLVDQRDRIMEQMIDREWTPAREVAIDAVTIDGKPAMPNPVARLGMPNQGALGAWYHIVGAGRGGRGGGQPSPPPETAAEPPTSYDFMLSEPGFASRETMPLNSVHPVLPDQSVEIVSRPQRAAFRPQRLLIAGPHPERWTIVDIVIGNRSQLTQGGELDGALFGQDYRGSVVVAFEPVQTAMDVRLTVRYDGPEEFGEVFRAALFGTTGDGWTGIEVAAGAIVAVKIRNLGTEGEFRAVWLATELAAEARSQLGVPPDYVEPDGDFDDEGTPLPDEDD